MLRNLVDKIDYTVFCVNEFARTHLLPYRVAFDYLDRCGAIDGITDFPCREFATDDEFEVSGYGRVLSFVRRHAGMRVYLDNYYYNQQDC